MGKRISKWLGNQSHLHNRSKDNVKIETWAKEEANDFLTYNIILKWKASSLFQHISYTDTKGNEYA